MSGTQSSKKCIEHMSWIVRFAKRPEIALLVAYAVGQGSYFALLIWLRSEGRAVEAGYVVLFISFLSLTFQFGDYGSTTHLNVAATEQNWGRLRGFQLGKCIFSIPTILISGIILMPPEMTKSAQILLLAAGVFCGVIFSFSPIALFESSGKYLQVGALQAAPWLLAGCIIFIVLMAGYDLKATWVQLLWVTIPCLVHLMAWSWSKDGVVRFLPVDIKAVYASFAVMAPIICGQIWGRQMIALILAVTSLELLATLGIVRGLHTAMTVLIGFGIRPAMAKQIRRHTQESSGSSGAASRNRFATSGRLKFAILISAAAIAAIQPVLIKHGGGEGYWMPILVGVPLWALAGVYIMENQINLAPRIASIFETSAMIVHALVFMVVYKAYPNLSFPIADAARLVLIFSLSAIANRKIGF